MNSNTDKILFFHVGTGKTGTTFLQYRVFPKFKGIYYIQRTKFHGSKSIIEKTNHKKYLLSSEFDRQLEYEVSKFTKNYPDTTPIIVFRRQDGYIASQYRRFVKNGFQGNFTNFFDIENDKGFFKKEHLNYNHQVEILKKYFTKEPAIFIYDELRNNPKKFIAKMAKLMDVTIDFDSINFNRKHTSYNEKQLKIFHNLSQRFDLRKRRVFKNGIMHFLWRLYMGSIRYSILYLSKLVPNSKVDSKPLIPKDELEKIKEYYKADWENISKRAYS